MNGVDRRDFVKAGCVAAGAGWAGTKVVPMGKESKNSLPDDPLFRISLAQWSLHRTLGEGKIQNLDFAKTAKQEFGIEGIEYVNQFFKDKANDAKYLADMKVRCEDQGVESLLIMVDGEGRLGDPDDAKRSEAVENHFHWVTAAKLLGCHSIRVNAASAGSFDTQIQLAADGLRRLSDFAASYGLNVIVENHGGLSSNGQWLAKTISTVDRTNCGTLPDFGNFRIQGDQWYDRYKGVTELMPFAKAVSAKSHKFDNAGNETSTDFTKMMKIVLDAGYRGWVGIEWEGGEPDEFAGIRLTKTLLEKVRGELAPNYNA